jgi:hypothetical protein
MAIQLIFILSKGVPLIMGEIGAPEKPNLSDYADNTIKNPSGVDFYIQNG